MSLLADEPPAPENLLKAALLSRAITDVQRIWRLKDDKTALASLHMRGLVGDDTMTRFAAAEKELEAEIVDVISEANTFKQGWGQFLFATATEMAQAEKTKEAVINMHKTRIAEGEVPFISPYILRVNESSRIEKRLARRAKYLLQKPQTQPSGPESQVQKVVAATGAAQSPAKVPLSQKEPSDSISQLTEGVRKESAEPKASMPVPSAVTPNSKVSTSLDVIPTLLMTFRVAVVRRRGRRSRYFSINRIMIIASPLVRLNLRAFHKKIHT